MIHFAVAVLWGVAWVAKLFVFHLPPIERTSPAWVACRGDFLSPPIHPALCLGLCLSGIVSAQAVHESVTSGLVLHCALHYPGSLVSYWGRERRTPIACGIYLRCKTEFVIATQGTCLGAQIAGILVSGWLGLALLRSILSHARSFAFLCFLVGVVTGISRQVCT